MLTFLKELKDSCSDDNQAIVDRLTVLESKALAKKKILVRDIGGFEEAMMEHSDAVISAVKTELEAFGSSLAETKQLVVQLKEGVDSMTSELLDELEKKVMRQQYITAKEMHELRQAVNERNMDVMNMLECKFTELDMLSIHRDMQTVKDLLCELKQGSDAKEETCMKHIRALEEKLSLQGTFLNSEIAMLRQQLHGNHEDVISLLEMKFDALNMLSIEQDIADIKLDIKVVLIKEDDILEKEEAILDGVQDIKVILGKVLAERNLSKDELQSRAKLLTKLRLSSTTSLQFKDGALLGQGGFGQVRLGIFNHSTKVAVKSVLASNNALDMEGVENEFLFIINVYYELPMQ